MQTKDRVEIDFGWWVFPFSLAAWRLSWCLDDGGLRLYEAGDDQYVLKLAVIRDREEVNRRLAGWTYAPIVPGRGGCDGNWLAARFPNAASYLRRERS